MQRGAVFDPSGAYRYHLWREWDAARPAVTFVMLNPSTAGADHDDPTIRRCLGFAAAWGFGRLEVVNLFAYRATDPRQLLKVADPVGPGNPDWLARALRPGNVVAAWGNGRLRVPAGVSPGPGDLHCLGLTALGEPRHPLYLPRTTAMQPYR